MPDRPWYPRNINRRRQARRGPVYRSGCRVEVLGPFCVRTGPGTITGVGPSSNVFVALDAGHDVLVGRRFVRPL